MGVWSVIQPESKADGHDSLECNYLQELELLRPASPVGCKIEVELQAVCPKASAKPEFPGEWHHSPAAKCPDSWEALGSAR